MPMVASDVNSIPTRFFQPALSSLAGAGVSALASDRLGELVTDTQDVDQCILIILTTPRGSCPHRPQFGSDLHLYIDWPLSTARPHIVRDAVTALREWEPRIIVTKVSVEFSPDAALSCVVEWIFADEMADAFFATALALGASR